MREAAGAGSGAPPARGGARLRAPLACLLLLLGVQAVVLERGGRLEPQRVPDTRTYLTAAKISGNLEAALSYRRSTGYGWFLRAFANDDWSFALERVPAAQLALYDAAVVLLFVALARCLTAPWLAFAGAAPLAASPALSMVDRVQPDFVALACVVAAFAWLMLLVVRPTLPRWLGLAVSVFASYQLRPAGFFLVALLPILGGLWVLIRNRVPLRRAFAFALSTAAATVLPYLAFATLRLVEVGHFGLVSFGGCNAAGVAVFFLDEELVAELDGELESEQADLARGLLEQRQRRGYPGIGEGDDPEAFREHYSDNIFRVAMGVALSSRKRSEAEAEAEGVDTSLWRPRLVEANDNLSALAGEVFRRRPRLYARWVLSSLELGVVQLGQTRWLTVPFWLLVASLPAAWLLAGRRGIGDRRGPGSPAGEADVLRRRGLACFAIGAVAYYAAYIAGISLVSFPFDRYFLSTMVFLPGVLIALLVEIWSTVGAERTRLPR